MPISNRELQTRDPFIMKQNHVNEYILQFLEKCNFNNVKLIKSIGPTDITSQKYKYMVYVKSKANQARNAENDLVFKDDQLDNQLGDQVEQMMRPYQKSVENIILVMGNPNIPRIRERVNKIKKALDKLEIVRFWVNEDGTIEFEGPKHLETILD